MSQHDEPVEGYQQPSGYQQPYGGQQPPPYPPQGHAGQQYPGGYPEPAWSPSGDGQAPVPAGPDAVQRLRESRPPSVRRLLQVMVAGAVVSLLSGVLGLLSVEEVVGQTAADLERAATEAGMDPATLVQLTGTLAAVVVVVGTLLAAGLWLLFAWLFARGQARVTGTVLGAVNGLSSLIGLPAALSPVELALALVTLGLVVAGLVLLWRRETSAWFGALRQARAQTPWSP